MLESVHIDEWSAMHVIGSMAIGMFMAARNHTYITSLLVVTAIGITVETLEYISHDPLLEEDWDDKATDMVLNTIGVTVGHLLGDELKK